MNKTSANAVSSFPRGRAIFLAAILGAAFVLPAVVGANNKTDQRAEARALIQKALDVSDFRAPGSPPFELRGTITVPLKKGKNATGTYLLDWVSPDRWREEIHVANYSRIRVGGAGKYWQQRSLTYELIPFYDLSRSFDYASELRTVSNTLLGVPALASGSEGKISLRRRKISGSDAECTAIGRSPLDFCFNSQTGVLIYIGVKRGSSTTYSSFTNFRGKLVPRVLEISDEKNSILSFRLETIAPLGNVDAALFQPFANADVWPTCDATVYPKPARGGTPVFRNVGLSGKVFFYFVAGTDGAVHNLKILAASSPEAADATVRALNTWKFLPQTCHGVPQRAEYVSMVDYGND